MIVYCTASAYCKFLDTQYLFPMVLILDGNSEIGAHLKSEIGILIGLGHLSRWKAVASLKLFVIQLTSFTRAQRGLSYHII